MRLLIVLGGVLLAALSCGACDHHDGDVEQPAPPAPPEPIVMPPITLPEGDTKPLGMIFVTVDTMRADYLSCYGHARILTPSFDRVAAGGVLFRQAITQSTTTSPSHSSMFTSLYPQDHNVYTNFEALGPEPRTLAELFSGRGFHTFSVVNMRHLNPEVGGLGQGVDTFIKSGYFRRAGPTIDYFLNWLDDLGEKPFYAWIHFADVHTPYQPPPPYNRFYYDDDERDPTKRSLQRIWPFLPEHMSDHPYFLSWLEGITDLEWVYAQYQGAVTYVDDEIGRLLDALEERALLQRTAIVLTSDHGESLGEHEMYFVHTGLYEVTAHVPLIMYFPGAGRQGVQVREVVEMVDVFPTVLDYFDIPFSGEIRGESLWPLIRGEMQPTRIALVEHAGKNQVALRSDKYKYIKHLKNMYHQPSYPFSAGREELYDLKRDPMERRDLSETHPEIVQVFRNELKMRRKDRLDLEAGDAEVSQETVEVLRALGYIR